MYMTELSFFSLANVVFCTTTSFDDWRKNSWEPASLGQLLTFPHHNRLCVFSSSISRHCRLSSASYFMITTQLFENSFLNLLLSLNYTTSFTFLSGLIGRAAHNDIFWCMLSFSFCLLSVCLGAALLVAFGAWDLRQNTVILNLWLIELNVLNIYQKPLLNAINTSCAMYSVTPTVPLLWNRWRLEKVYFTFVYPVMILSGEFFLWIIKDYTEI